MNMIKGCVHNDIPLAQAIEKMFYGTSGTIKCLSTGAGWPK